MGWSVGEMGEMESTGSAVTDYGVIVGRALARCLVAMMHYLASSKQQAQAANSVVMIALCLGRAQGQGAAKGKSTKLCTLEPTSRARTYPSTPVLQSSVLQAANCGEVHILCSVRAGLGDAVTESVTAGYLGGAEEGCRRIMDKYCTYMLEH